MLTTTIAAAGRRSGGPGDQAHMSGVQVAHGGHKPNTQALTPPAQGRPLHGGNGYPNDTHGPDV